MPVLRRTSTSWFDPIARLRRIVQLGVKPNRIDLITSIAGVNFEEAWENRVAGTLDGLPVT